MAVFQDRQWILTSADVGTVISLDHLKVSQVRWVAPGAAADQAVRLTSPSTGNVLPGGHIIANGPHFMYEEKPTNWWPDGFKVTQLDTGTVYVVLA